MYGLFVPDVPQGTRIGRMSPRGDIYRQRAAEAKKRAAEASNLHVKSAFKEVARGWLVLAEQMEWMEHQDEATEGKIPH